MSTNVELWEIVPNFENYEVSSLGRVRNRKTGRIIKQSLNEYGYCLVDLHDNGTSKHFKVHRLIAGAFITNVNNKPQVNHIDGNKANNMVSNLEWVDQSENVKHCYSRVRKKGSPPKQKPVVCVETGKIYDSISEAARCFGVTRRSIQRVLFSDKLTACGYHWEFA